MFIIYNLFARKATHCGRYSPTFARKRLIADVIVRLLRVSDLGARSDLCVQSTALRVYDLLRMIRYVFARKRLMRSRRLDSGSDSPTFARKRLRLQGLIIRCWGCLRGLWPFITLKTPSKWYDWPIRLWTSDLKDSPKNLTVTKRLNNCLNDPIGWYDSDHAIL